MLFSCAVVFIVLLKYLKIGLVWFGFTLTGLTGPILEIKGMQTIFQKKGKHS